MRRMNPYLMIAIGFMLVGAGFLLPFLMVLRVVEPALVLSFAAHFSSLTGLLLTVYGLFQRASEELGPPG